MTPKDLSNARVASRQTYLATMRSIPADRSVAVGWPAEARHRALLAADDVLQQAGANDHWRVANLYAAAAARSTVWLKPL